MNQQSTSLWAATSSLPSLPSLRGDVQADVAIIGGGITGLTAALLLAERGRSVVLLEKESIGSGETGNTTAHLTAAIDARYSELRHRFGPEEAALIAAGAQLGLETIAGLVKTHAIDCRFRRVPGYLFTERRGKVAELKKEAVAAKEAGLEAEWQGGAPLPFETRGAVLFRDQAQFHPLDYLRGLTKAAQERGVRIFEHSMVSALKEGKPFVLETSEGRVLATDVFQATNQPVFGFTAVHTKGSAWRTYAIAFEAPGAGQDGLFWDTADPYHYIRWQETDGGTFLIVGGEDHRVGEESDTAERFERLVDYTRERFGTVRVIHRWSGQVVEPHGGIPMIGGGSGMYVSTGYAGQGMTFGTLGAMIVSDLITGVENRWAEVFAFDRVLAHVATREYLTQNAPFAGHLLADRLTSHDVEGSDAGIIGRGEGKIIESSGRKVAVFRDDDGMLHAVSPVCTHMKCDVAWNTTERTWDCPCHGSRFDPDGAVLNGPAHTPLQKISLERRETENEDWRRERDSNPR